MKLSLRWAPPFGGYCSSVEAWALVALVLVPSFISKAYVREQYGKSGEGPKELRTKRTRGEIHRGCRSRRSGCQPGGDHGPCCCGRSGRRVVLRGGSQLWRVRGRRFGERPRERACEHRRVRDRGRFRGPRRLRRHCPGGL